VSAILKGTLAGARFEPDPLFRVLVPTAVPGVPEGILSPRRTWPDPAAYDAKAREVAELFRKNFEPYAAGCSPAVRAAGPAL
jgi:phosphoenolpyruvate carboxykinase (ATP)